MAKRIVKEQVDINPTAIQGLLESRDKTNIELARTLLENVDITPVLLELLYHFSKQHYDGLWARQMIKERYKFITFTAINLKSWTPESTFVWTLQQLVENKIPFDREKAFNYILKL